MGINFLNKGDKRARFNKLSLIVIVLFLILSILGVFAFSGGGTGTSADPYQVSSIEELNETRNNLTVEYILTENLDFNSCNSYDNCSKMGEFNSGSGWLPIGTIGAGFEGVFNGNNHTISNLYINRAGSNFIGLFGRMNGNVSNLGLLDINITSAGGTYIGGIAGETGGLGSHIFNSYVTGLINGSGTDVGGIAGGNYGSIEKCYSEVNVKGSSSVGSFVGNNYDAGPSGVGGLGNITNSYSTGSVNRTSGGQVTFGGFSGRNVEGQITNSYSTGAVYYEGTTNPTTKGFVGDQTTDELWKDEYNFWDNQTSGQTSTTGNATGKVTLEMKEITTFLTAGWNISLIGSYNSEVWYIDNGTDYPRLNWEYNFIDIDVNSPFSQVYNSNSIEFNIKAVSNIGIDTCWYTLDNGFTNITLPKQGAWNLSLFSYDNVNISNQGNNELGFLFKPDGKRFYDTDGTLNKTFQYICSDAWNLSSCSYIGVNISTQSRTEDISFKPDGTRFWEIGSTTDFPNYNGTIFQYSCTDAWNISSCSYDNIKILIHTGGVQGDSLPGGIFVKPDGTKLYEVWYAVYAQGMIYQYNCSDAWNLSSCSYESKQLFPQGTAPEGIEFNQDGTKFYELSDQINGKVYQYSCSTPWGLNTCTYDSIYFALNHSNPRDFTFKTDGTRLYELGLSDHKSFQYSIPFSNNYTSVNSSMSDGSHTALFYCNDTTNKVNNGEVIFTTNSLILSVISPLDGQRFVEDTPTGRFNVSLSLDGDTCYYSLNNGSNVSMTKFNSTYFYSIDTSNVLEGDNTVQFSCNATTGSWFTPASINFSTDPKNITKCRTLYTGRVYELSSNITLDVSLYSECISFEESNIYLDGNGYTINTSLGSGGRLIYLRNSSDGTIENISVYDLILNGEAEDVYGIYSVFSSNSSFHDLFISINGTNGAGLYSSGYSLENSFFNNYFNCSGWNTILAISSCTGTITTCSGIASSDWCDGSGSCCDGYGCSSDGGATCNVSINPSIDCSSDSYCYYPGSFGECLAGYPKNYFNTTKSVGARIFSSGVDIGGNYWDNSTGGASGICADADTDGFCDLVYDVVNDNLTGNCSTNNCDYLAYSNGYLSGDTEYPQFSTYYDNNGSLIDTGIGLFNVTIISTNGTVWLEINNTNLTATNLTSNVYNVSYNFSLGGVYSYKWHSWGNGTSNNYNVSETRSYTVNKTSVDTTPPYFTSIPNNVSINYTQGFGVDFNASDETGFGAFSINDTTLFSINSSGWLTNSTKNIVVGLHYINVTINDTSNNLNSTIYLINISKATSSTCGLFVNPGATVTYPTATAYTKIETDPGDADVTYHLFRDDVEVSIPDAVTLGAGSYDYVLNLTGGQNWTDKALCGGATLTVNKGNATANMVITGTTPITYPTASGFTYSETNTGDGNCIYDMSVINSTYGLGIIYGAGTWVFNYSVSGCSNYSDGSITKNLVVSQNTTYTLSLSVLPSNNITYPTIANVTGSGCPNELICNLSINSSGIVDNPYGSTLGAKIYNFTYNTTGNTNYSGKIVSKILTINQNKSGRVYTYLRDVRGNLTISNDTAIWLNGTLFNVSGDISLYNNGTLINTGASPLSNFTNFTSLGIYNITAIYLGDENYSGSSETWWLDVELNDTTPPVVNCYYPANTSTITSNPVIFRYNVSDNNTILSCSLVINNVTLSTNTTITRDTEQNFSMTFATDGRYYFKVNCSDAFSNTGITGEQYITIALPPPAPTSGGGSRSDECDNNFDCDAGYECVSGDCKKIVVNNNETKKGNETLEEENFFTGKTRDDVNKILNSISDFLFKKGWAVYIGAFIILCITLWFLFGRDKKSRKIKRGKFY